MKSLFLFFVAALVISACASSPIIRGSRTFKGQKPAPAVLKVVNDHPVDIMVDVNDREFGILAHSSVKVPARTGTEYRVRRKTFLNGDRGSDIYRFFIPEDSVSRTVVFGGVQTGVILNHSGTHYRAKVATASGHVTDWIESGKGAELKFLPDWQLLIIKFEDGRVYTDYTDKPIDDVRADRYLQDCDCWVDFIIRITPEIYRQAKR